MTQTKLDEEINALQTRLAKELRSPRKILDEIRKFESEKAFLDDKTIYFLEQKLLLKR